MEHTIHCQTQADPADFPMICTCEQPPNTESDKSIDETKKWTVDRLLNQVAYRGYVAGQGKDRGDGEILYIQSEIVVERAKDQIYSLLMDVIGEDDKYNDFCDHCSDWDDGRNQLREELRTKIAEIQK